MAEGEGEVVGSVQVGWDVKRWVGVAVEDGKEEDGVVDADAVEGPYCLTR